MRKLITASKPLDIRPPMPVSRGFARFLGRPLTRVERIVISRLERARQNNSPVIVIDPPGTDSSSILRTYLDYRLSLAIPRTIGVIYDGRTRSSIRRLPDRKEIWYLSNRRPRRIAGCNPEFVLMLNVQTFGPHSPFKPKSGNFFEICSTVFPTLGSGFIIIHFQSSEKNRTFPLDLPEITSLPPPRILLREAKLHTTIPFIIGPPPDRPPAAETPSRNGPAFALVRQLRSAELRPTIKIWPKSVHETKPPSNRPLIKPLGKSTLTFFHPSLSPPFIHYTLYLTPSPSHLTSHP